MARLAMIVEYDGSSFYGSQRQLNLPTVQRAVEEAVEGICGHPVRLGAAGRTDRGVHALGQVLAVTLETPIPVEGWVTLLNKVLRPSVRVRRAWWAPDDFDPRRNALRRAYRYIILYRPEVSVFLDRYAWLLPRPLDHEAMREAACVLEGDHYFVSFCKCPSEALRLNLTLDEALITPIDGGVAIDFRARSFARGMVRHMVGALVAVGKGEADAGWVRSLLETRRKKVAPPIAPPAGLYLVRVDYPPGLEKN